jgi:hypothetical protein
VRAEFSCIIAAHQDVVGWLSVVALRSRQEPGVGRIGGLFVVGRRGWSSSIVIRFDAGAACCRPAARRPSKRLGVLTATSACHAYMR